MTTPTRWNPIPAFKAKVALAAIKDEKALARLAQQSDVHPHQITAWKGYLLETALDLSGPGGGASEPAPVIDVKILRIKIGERTLENCFYPVHLARPACGGPKQ